MAVYDFAVGQTNPDTFPVEEFKQAAIRAIDNEHDAFNRYPGNKGHEGLRKAMAERESKREGVPVDPEQIAIMNGSMQAVTLVGQALRQGKDDIVITEEYTYSGTIGAYKGIGLEMVGIPLDDHGMRMDALSEKLKELSDADRLPRFIYTLTTYHWLKIIVTGMFTLKVKKYPQCSRWMTVQTRFISAPCQRFWPQVCAWVTCLQRSRCSARS
jgi:2-aminoadipate transaminase